MTITFELPAFVGASLACVCGDFNLWSPHAHPMLPRPEGRFELSLLLERGRDYRFRYLLDNGRWENDWAADRYEPNVYGGSDSVVST